VHSTWWRSGNPAPPTQRIREGEVYLVARRPRQMRKSKRRARRERRSGAAAQRRSGVAAQRRSGAAAQRRSDAQALTTPPSNRSSRSKLTFALVRVSCEIQRSERARLLVAPGKARRPLPPLLFAVACSNTTDGGTADLARVLRLAPADARFWAYCRAASRAVVDFSLSTGGKEGENRPVVCLIPG
jgi:hypothetical protein